MKKIGFGIDLGTTNSALAVYTGGIPETIPINGNRTIPSVVWYHPDGTTTVGGAAYARKGKPDVVYSSKRDMGTSTVYHLTLEDGSNKDVTPIEVASEVLKAIVKYSDKSYGEVNEAVITVPAYFNEAQRSATRKAAELAGIKLISMINEPTAAALAYGINKKKNTGENIIVCDVGGGTTDITLMNITNYDEVPAELEGLIEPGLNFDVLATSGDNRLGGDDYDEYSIEACKTRLLSENKKNRKSIDKGDTEAKAENTRIEKFIRTNFTIEKYKPLIEMWKQTDERYRLNVTCTAEDGKVENFSFHTEDLVTGFNRFWNRIDACIESALNVTAINEDGSESFIGRHQDPTVCLPVGGSTKNPWLVEKLQEKFKHTGLTIPNNTFADEAIALGAAVQAAITLGIESNITLKEVNPLPIGIETLGDRNGKLVPDVFVPVIPKDITIPVSRTFVYETSEDNQEFFNIKIYQGVSSYASKNQLLGNLIIPDLPKKPAGEVTVIIELSVDFNGILTVNVFRDGKEISAQFNSILNTSTRNYSRTEEKTFTYLLNVKDYMEAHNLVDTSDYADVCNWVPGKPVPKYAIDNSKAVSSWVRDCARSKITDLFKDSVDDESDEDE